MHRGQAIAYTLLGSKLDASLDLLKRHRRNVLPNQFMGTIEQYARRLARLLVPQDLAVFRVLRIFTDAGYLQGLPVGPSGERIRPTR